MSSRRFGAGCFIAGPCTAVHDNALVSYVTTRYTLEAKMKERDIDAEGLATYVLIKGTGGSWKIRHSHTSSRPARRPAG